MPGLEGLAECVEVILYATSKSTFKRFLTIALVGVLSVQLSGVTIPRVFAEQTSSSEKSLKAARLAQLQELESALAANLQSLVKRARYPEKPGVKGGMPSAQEPRLVERQFDDYRYELENLLASLSDQFSSATTWELISDYFEHLASLGMLYVFAREPQRAQGALEDWLGRYSLHLPEKIAYEVPGLLAGSHDRLGAQYHSVVIDRDSDRLGAPVSLRMSSAFLHGLAVGKLAQNPKSANYNTMIRYLVVRQLFQNLSELRFLRADRQIEFPAIPEPLASELLGLGDSEITKALFNDIAEISVEPQIRRKLMERIAETNSGMPTFANSSEIRTMAEILVADTAVAGVDLVGTFSSFLAAQFEYAASQQASFMLRFKGLINSGNWMFAVLTDEQAKEVVRNVVAHAHALLQIGILQELRKQVKMSPDQRVKIFEEIRRRQREYAAALPDSWLMAMTQGLRAEATAELYKKQRTQFISNLWFNARRLNEQLTLSAAGDAVDFEVLQRVNTVELAELQMRSTVKEWYGQVVELGEYRVAQKKYQELTVEIKKQLAPENLDPGKILNASEDLNEESRNFILEARKDDLNDWVQIGKIFSFDRDFSSTSPVITAADVLPSKKHELYQEFRKEKIRSEYPVLSIEVINLEGKKVPLYEALALVKRSQASALADQAIQGLEVQIRKNIQKVSQSQDLEEIATVLRGSLMTQIVDSVFPEFDPARRAFIEKLGSPALVDQVKTRYVDPYLSYIGSAYLATVFLAQVGAVAAKKFAPRYVAVFEPMLLEMGPALAGASAVFWPAMVASLGYDAAGIQTARTDARKTESFFASRAQGLSFFQYGEVQVADLSVDQRVEGFGLNLLFLGVFGGWSVKARLSGEAGLRSTLNSFFKDCEAFRTLEIPGGTWDKRQIAQAFESRVTSDPNRYKLYEQSRDWLLNQMKKGQTWDPEALIAKSPKTKLEKRIMKAMEGLLKANKEAAARRTAGGAS